MIMIVILSWINISFQLDQKLIELNYYVDRLVNYRTNHIEKFDIDLIDNLKSQIPDIVYIYGDTASTVAGA